MFQEHNMKMFLFAFPVFVLCFAIEGVQCESPDTSIRCPIWQTPCIFGCCPLWNGVCCLDGKHCCRQGQMCDPYVGKCTGLVNVFGQYSFETQNAVPLTTSILNCPTGNTECAQDRCCPYEQAVCCGDGEHCCPKGYRCDVPNGMCISDSTGSQTPVRAMNAKSSYITCPDARRLCPGYMNCCRKSDGDWGCCPKRALPQLEYGWGECCDTVYGTNVCCPNEYPICTEIGCKRYDYFSKVLPHHSAANFAALSAIRSGSSTGSLYLVQGRDAKEGEFPWMVSLHYKDKFVCNSFLITPKVLLTAARCFYQGNKTEDYKGYVGSIERDGPDTEIRFTEIIIHSNYGPGNTENDIALIILTKDIDLNDNSQTVCLPTKESFYENLTAQIMGWGASVKGGPESTKILQTATQNVPTNERCASVYASYGIKVTRKHVCAGGEEGKGICYGDYGSPLVAQQDQARPIAIGVASFISSQGCGVKDIPAVFTHVPSYMHWVTVKIGDEEAARLCILGQKPS